MDVGRRATESARPARLIARIGRASVLMATVGVELNSEAFCQGGFAATEKLVAEFESLL